MYQMRAYLDVLLPNLLFFLCLIKFPVTFNTDFHVLVSTVMHFLDFLNAVLPEILFPWYSTTSSIYHDVFLVVYKANLLSLADRNSPPSSVSVKKCGSSNFSSALWGLLLGFLRESLQTEVVPCLESNTRYDIHCTKNEVFHLGFLQ